MPLCTYDASLSQVIMMIMIMTLIIIMMVIVMMIKQKVDCDDVDYEA